MGIPPEIVVPLEQKFREAHHAIDRRGWCSECIAEVRVKYARRQGKPDPFPVFENTLNANHRVELNELRELLISNFQFAESRGPRCPSSNDSLAVFVWSGAYTRPVRVQVYYVTSVAEQQRIVRIVEDFFQLKERNQVHIEFYEAENWRCERHPESGTIGYSRGPEVLLKAVALNC